MSEQWNRYDLTAGRPHGKPGRDIRPSGVTIDLHAHVGIARAAEIAKPHFDMSTVPLAQFASAETKALSAKQEADIAPASLGYDKRLADLDAMGIDVQVVCPPPPQCYYTIPLDIAVTATRALNDGIAEYVAGKPDRLVGLGSVPLADAHEAVAELERCMATLGLKGVEVLTNVGGKELSEPMFAPFWARAETLGAVVLLHPNGFTEGQRLSRFYFNNIIGNPLETTIALHYLIFDGVLERHPRLKLVAAHGGGYLGSYPGRIDHAWGARSDCHAGLKKPPTDYLKQIYVDTVVFTPHQLAELVRVFGADHVLMGTDYPYDMGEYDPVGHIAAVPEFDTATVAAIAGGNAKRLLGL